MSGGANSDSLADLHELLAGSMKEDLLRAINKGEGVPPQLMSNIIKFLKDNKIEALNVKDSPLDKLTQALPFPTDSEIMSH